jgi:hypothetical protein
MSHLSLQTYRKILMVPFGVFTFLAEAFKPRCLALHTRVASTGKRTCQTVREGIVDTKSPIPTAALAAKIGTCAPGSLTRAGKGSYICPGAHHNAGVIKGTWLTTAT